MALPLVSIGLALAKYVPDVIDYFKGEKAGDAARNIINIAEEVTGKTGEKAIDVLDKDPAVALEFKKAVLSNKADMDKLYLSDIKDARKRDIELRKIGYRNTRADLMIIVAIVALVVNIYLLATNPALPESIVAIFNMMVGSLLTMLNSAYQFEFGSSRGSKEKDLR